VLETYKKIIADIKNDKYDFLSLRHLDQTKLLNLSNELSIKYHTIIIIGFGASSLNVRTLVSALARPLKKVIYLDSLDQLEIDTALAGCDLDNSIFFSLSKSGNTNETYLLTKYALEMLKVIPQNLYVISPTGDNLLFNLSQAYNTNYLEHDVKGSGRFSIISLSAMLPAMVIGVDIMKIISAIKAKLSNIINGQDNNVLITSQHYMDNYNAGKDILVTFNYSYQLDGLLKWHQQMIGESLGKKGFGITPILSRGTFDQHSQLQLYLEGPRNKFYKIISNNNGQENNSKLAIMLAKHSNNIHQALIKSKQSVILKNFPYINEQIIGEYIIETMLTIMLIAFYKKLNPFDQPSVDFYKILKV